MNLWLKTNNVNNQWFINFMTEKKKSLGIDEQILKNIIRNFHKEPYQQRHEKLKKIFPQLDIETLIKGGLSLELADNMIENCIGVIPIPLGLGIGFKVNRKNFVVPMAIEEPSVIAAASVIARLISEKGSGF